MGRYSHLTIEEREDVMCLRRQVGVKLLLAGAPLSWT